mmetsp:Transcript_6132/g.19853  ORF Transcript_6132/g.19853 Transcript_6132/m.19853 type:complete len:210 (+) Transcript_6132:2234-2863(+)
MRRDLTLQAHHNRSAGVACTGSHVAFGLFHVEWQCGRSLIALRFCRVPLHHLQEAPVLDIARGCPSESGDELVKVGLSELQRGKLDAQHPAELAGSDGPAVKLVKVEKVGLEIHPPLPDVDAEPRDERVFRSLLVPLRATSARSAGDCVVHLLRGAQMKGLQLCNGGLNVLLEPAIVHDAHMLQAGLSSLAKARQVGVAIGKRVEQGGP